LGELSLSISVAQGALSAALPVPKDILLYIAGGEEESMQELTHIVAVIHSPAAIQQP
jgi:hypothetical protein